MAGGANAFVAACFTVLAIASASAGGGSTRPLLSVSTNRLLFQVQSRYGVTVVPNVLSSVPSVAQSSHIRVSLTRHE